ncbi:MAG TPA: Fur family transcriptional regulator [Solirubrobacteraceae bacterium]|jgi:Fur family ferric uptake transcriptional regulator|nr:Fur family transcriptional regulator [Solirubrobacteraceae bacterium]
MSMHANQRADFEGLAGAGASARGNADGNGEADGAAEWIQRAEAALTAAGRKRGGARHALLELLARQMCALTAPQIEDALRRQSERPVSRASIYRILEQLEGLGLVQRVETGQAMVRYERVCEHHDHHHHLVCDECGVVMPFSDPELERAITKLSERVPLAVSEHEIVLHGACRDCAA